jgi:hypothetical protein
MGWRSPQIWDNGAGMIVQVQCYAGRKADERPVRFRMGERDYMVEEIVEQWYGPDDTFYKVRADDQSLYLLRFHPSTGTWGIDVLPSSPTS